MCMQFSALLLQYVRKSSVSMHGSIACSLLVLHIIVAPVIIFGCIIILLYIQLPYPVIVGVNIMHVQFYSGRDGLEINYLSL